MTTPFTVLQDNQPTRGITMTEEQIDKLILAVRGVMFSCWGIFFVLLTK